MTGKGARDKGANGEREVAKILRDHGYDKAHRGMVFYHEKDIEDGIPGIHLEVKRQEKTQLKAWMQQSEEQKKAGEIASVVHRRNREQWLITMKFIDFLDYLRKETKQ